MDIFVIFDYRSNIIGYTEDSASAENYCNKLEEEGIILRPYYERVKPIK